MMRKSTLGILVGALLVTLGTPSATHAGNPIITKGSDRVARVRLYRAIRRELSSMFRWNVPEQLRKRTVEGLKNTVRTSDAKTIETLSQMMADAPIVTINNASIVLRSFGRIGSVFNTGPMNGASSGTATVMNITERQSARQVQQAAMKLPTPKDPTQAAVLSLFARGLKPEQALKTVDGRRVRFRDFYWLEGSIRALGVVGDKEVEWSLTGKARREPASHDLVLR